MTDDHDPKVSVREHKKVSQFVADRDERLAVCLLMQGYEGRRCDDTAGQRILPVRCM